MKTLVVDCLTCGNLNTVEVKVVNKHVKAELQCKACGSIIRIQSEVIDNKEQ